MKDQYYQLFPILLIVLGVISISGINFFGSAALESACWKQNVIISLLMIFCMLPTTLQKKKSIWISAGVIFLFLLFGGANFWGVIGIMLMFEKMALAILALLLSYRLFSLTWKVNKLYMIFAGCLILSVALLFPIEDENIVGSGFRALTQWSYDRFTSDQGFHIYLGLTGILAGVVEFIIRQNKTESSDAAKDQITE